MHVSLCVTGIHGVMKIAGTDCARVFVRHWHTWCDEDSRN